MRDDRCVCEVGMILYQLENTRWTGFYILGGDGVQ